jgi:hypothetical protein
VKQILLISILLTTLYACGQSSETTGDYPAHVGDIQYDPKIDDPAFKICDYEALHQYYNFGKGLHYKGEKISINEHFKTKLKTKEQQGESGFLTIRFVVNCEGQTGRYRIQGMDNEYNPKNFSDELAAQLLNVTKQLDGWLAGEYEGRRFDYYQYLTFKIENGHLIEIMP